MAFGQRFGAGGLTFGTSFGEGHTREPYDFIALTNAMRKRAEAAPDESLRNFGAPGVAAPDEQQVNPLAQLLQMFGLGSGEGPSNQSMRQQIIQQSPYTAQINELRRQIAQAGAQTEQNIADVGSWFGQLGGTLKSGRKANRKAGKAALRSNRKDLQGLLGSGMIGDSAITSDVRGAAMDEARYLRSSNLENQRFDTRSLSDAARQQEYQQFVLQRLGQQQQADMRAQIGGLRSQRQASMAEAMSEQGDEQWSRMMQVLGLVPQEQRAAMLGLPGEAQDPREALEFDWKWRDRLAEAMGGITPTYKSKDAKSGEETTASSFRNFQELLNAYQSAATGSGLDINDPAVRDAYRRYIASYVLDKWNPYAQSAGLSPMQLDPSNPTQFIGR